MGLVEKHPLFILVGPTAVGKTDISIEIAKKMAGEIISGDSMQVYKYLDIGTAKIKPQERQGIPHYLIDIKHPIERYSVAEFKDNCEQAIAKIAERKKLPMIVGGTGLYINAVINDYNFMENNSVEEMRQQLWDIVEKKGIGPLLGELSLVDPISGRKIHPNDTKRIIRALEVYYTTGKPISTYHDLGEKDNFKGKYNYLMVGLIRDRDNLYKRINQRVEEMMQEGWLEEIDNLLKQGVPPSAPGFQGLGYKQLLRYLNGEISLDYAVELIKRDTRRFAKRQLTWFKRDKRIKWIDLDKLEKNTAINEIILLIGRSMDGNVEI